MNNNNPINDPGLPLDSRSQANESGDMNGASEPSLSTVSNQDALTLLVQDPVAFVRQIVTEEAVKHLSRLKEEAELRGALNAFRKNNPDFVRFEPMILQEVASLIQNDPDGHVDPWDVLLEKATNIFKQKFQSMIKDGSLQPAISVSQPPFIEKSGNRTYTEQPPTFSREQIANMSMGDYLKNEAAIDDALKGKRIV